MAVLGSSVTITAIAVLGGVGALPSAAESSHHRAPAALEQVADQSTPTRPDRSAERRNTLPVYGLGSADAAEYRARTLQTTLPARSGTGRRVVFSQGRQRVWLVGAKDQVRRTYLVSGSVTDNLSRGTYEVYSRSEQAWGIDDSGTMKYFVRFTQGKNAAIGFHDIPVDDGHLVQSVADLGTPQSHGCIRQRRADAVALWRFAPVGTTVVVV
jgi:lipoprotein-anchoring transpeptidase ErfK/SrfK